MKKLDMEVIEKTIENLRKNNFYAEFARRKEDVTEIIKTLVPKGSAVSSGGSLSLEESGVLDFLKSGYYNFYDRTAYPIGSEKIKQVHIDAFNTDAYFCSSNAVTENGELYNVDGNANRVACILYGPRQVIMVVGYNKIVKNLDAAVLRVKEYVAPENCKRLGLKSYCAINGKCVSLNSENPDMSQGCKSETRICSNFVVSAKQRDNNKDRIKVIIVGEELGY